MSDHQPAADDPDPDRDVATAPAEGDRETAQDTAADPHELDFSRLRMARASLDAAFPQE